jgi:hypothetical protein
MARALGDILTELNTVYDPQKALVKEQMATIDPSQSAEMQGLQSAQQDAFQAITDQANRRGMFYSGAPISEQQKYTGATYLPAVANLRAKYAQQKFNLQDTLNKIQADQQLKAQGIYQEEVNRDLQRQLADEAAARARSAGGGGGGGGGYDFGGLGGGAEAGGAAGGAPASMNQRSGGGFNFSTSDGQALSAAQYSKMMGIPFRSLLQTMANAGDSGARAALDLVGNDYGYNRTKISNQNQVNLLRALGVPGVGNYQAPKPTTTLANLNRNPQPAFLFNNKRR